MKKTLYEVLGVDAKATTEEIVARYNTRKFPNRFRGAVSCSRGRAILFFLP